MAIQLVQELGLVKGSKGAQAILQLGDNLVSQLLETFNPEEDALIHVDQHGFTINHGSVGSHGIRYEFY